MRVPDPRFTVVLPATEAPTSREIDVLQPMEVPDLLLTAAGPVAARRYPGIAGRGTESGGGMGAELQTGAIMLETASFPESDYESDMHDLNGLMTLRDD